MYFLQQEKNRKGWKRIMCEKLYFIIKEAMKWVCGGGNNHSELYGYYSIWLFLSFLVEFRVEFGFNFELDEKYK